MPPLNLIATPGETDERWRALHERFAVRMLESLQISERGRGHGGRKEHVDERLVQAIWSDQLFRKNEISTASGKALEILEPGRWNTAAGPDFLDARIRLAGEVLSGDIEIHVDSADWSRHGHHKDFGYNRVVLHVGLFAHDDRPFDEKQNGERMERLILEDYLEPDLETIRQTLNLTEYPYGRPDDLGICHKEFERIPAEGLVEFLRVAGRSRVEQKIARYRNQMATADFLQVIFQSLLTAQGFKSSKTLYFLLSKRAPIAELMEYARDFPASDQTDFFLSALLNVAQLVPQQRDFVDEADEETLELLTRLDKFWRPARPYFSDRLIPPTKRWFAGLRPAGFPPRRLSAIAILMNRLTDPVMPLYEEFSSRVTTAEFDAMKPKEIRRFWKELTALFEVGGDESYFGTHYTIGGKKQRPQALLGTPAARSMIFNVFLPMVILKAREERRPRVEEKTWQALYRFPKLEENSVTKFMKRRLFGESETNKGLFTSEIFQQSLFKVFGDCCAHNEKSCDDCTFLALAERIQHNRKLELK